MLLFHCSELLCSYKANAPSVTAARCRPPCASHPSQAATIRGAFPLTDMSTTDLNQNYPQLHLHLKSHLEFYLKKRIPFNSRKQPAVVFCDRGTAVPNEGCTFTSTMEGVGMLSFLTFWQLSVLKTRSQNTNS